MVTVVGGKLTTYRRMAEDAVDAAVAHAGLDAGPCRTRTAAAARRRVPGGAGRARAARAGWSAATAPTPALVLDSAREVSGLPDDELLAPVADGVPVTLAELLFGVTHEGAADVDDLLDRRTRVGLVPADRSPPGRPPRALELVAPAARHRAMSPTFERPSTPVGSSRQH